MFAIILYASTASGHGNMAWPPTWHEGQAEVPIELKKYETCSSGACMWFTNNTSIFPHEPTMAEDSPLRTYPFKHLDESTRYTPWWAPGRASVHGPCGVYGGNPYGCPAGDPNGTDCPGGGAGFGPDAREYVATHDAQAQTTTWEAGSVQDVMWNIKANHGGGYAYRLCMVPDEGVTGVTETCFQQGHLDFFGDKSWAQWGPDFKNRTEFTAVRTKTGTWPPNSEWTKDPVPACRAEDGGVFSEDSDDCEKSGGYQFDTPAPGVHGYGEYFSSQFMSTFGFVIVDKVQIPSNLKPGKYVLSFRWDCEQTPQVWTTCADIAVVGGKHESAAQAPAKTAAQAPAKEMPQKVLRTMDYANGI